MYDVVSKYIKHLTDLENLDLSSLLFTTAKLMKLCLVKNLCSFSNHQNQPITFTKQSLSPQSIFKLILFVNGDQ